MVGEGQKSHGDLSDCFNLYSSKDWSAWKFESCIMRNQDVKAPQGSYPWRIERPKIFKCPGTGKYMMWFHCDTSGFTMKSVGVLTSDAVTGPYSFVGQCFRPDNEGAPSFSSMPPLLVSNRLELATPPYCG